MIFFENRVKKLLFNTYVYILFNTKDKLNKVGKQSIWALSLILISEH